MCSKLGNFRVQIFVEVVQMIVSQSSCSLLCHVVIKCSDVFDRLTASIFRVTKLVQVNVKMMQLKKCNVLVIYEGLREFGSFTAVLFSHVLWLID